MHILDNVTENVYPRILSLIKAHKGSKLKIKIQATFKSL